MGNCLPVRGERNPVRLLGAEDTTGPGSREAKSRLQPSLQGWPTLLGSTPPPGGWTRRVTALGSHHPGGHPYAFFQNQLSGYLLRKFKNSNGWQKLWVVFTNFCLFFYKTHQVGRPPLPPAPAVGRLTLLPGAGRVAGRQSHTHRRACAALQDDHPLASLPLLGYRVSVPQEADGILKEHVFKLQFKSHVYFFRAESKYTFGR